MSAAFWIQQAAAVLRVANERGNPPHGLRLDFRGGRGERPGAHVGVDRRGQEVAEDADWCRRGGDVSEEARVGVQQRVLEQQAGRAFQQRARFGA